MGTKRITYDGRETDYDTMTQQHLSNIFWYNNIILGGEKDELALNQIDLRFSGEILPYKPLIKFRTEIRTLHKNGNLYFDVFNNRWEVKFQGVVVGFMDETQEEVEEALIPRYLSDSITLFVSPGIYTMNTYIQD